MRSIKTMSIVPVDLNAFMCINFRIMAAFYEIGGNFQLMRTYQDRYESMKRELRHLNWNETDGIWYDYDLETQSHSNTYYVSNAFPLYAKCYNEVDGDERDLIPHRVYAYLKREGVLNFTKGIPTSLAMGSEQQWDKENAWPPMVHLIIEGFRTSGDLKLMKVAEQMATQWLVVNYRAYGTTYAMFEKYNASLMNDEYGAGSGGEYEVQKGFGWTNGVILDLLDKYGAIVDVSKGSRIGMISTLLLIMLALLVALLPVRFSYDD